MGKAARPVGRPHSLLITTVCGSAGGRSLASVASPRPAPREKRGLPFLCQGSPVLTEPTRSQAKGKEGGEGWGPGQAPRGGARGVSSCSSPAQLWEGDGALALARRVGTGLGLAGRSPGTGRAGAPGRVRLRPPCKHGTRSPEAEPTRAALPATAGCMSRVRDSVVPRSSREDGWTLAAGHTTARSVYQLRLTQPGEGTRASRAVTMG